MSLIQSSLCAARLVGLDRQHVVDQARRLGRGVERAASPGSAFIACPAIGCQAPMASTWPEASTCGVSLVLALTSVTSFSLMPRFFKRVEQQQMLDQADLDADLLALEILEALDARLADDHVVAVRIVGEHDHDALAAARAGDQRVAVGHQIGVDLAGGEGIHRGRIVEPLELDVDAGLLEPALVDGDLPGDPARPIAVSDRQAARPHSAARRSWQTTRGPRIAPKAPLRRHRDLLGYVLRSSEPVILMSKPPARRGREDNSRSEDDQEALQALRVQSSPVWWPWTGNRTSLPTAATEVSRVFIPPCTRAEFCPGRQLSDLPPRNAKAGTLATNSQ